MRVLYIAVLLTISNITIAQTRWFGYIINDKGYSLIESDVNTQFSNAFDEMIRVGVAKESELQLWYNTFNDWKNMFQPGVITYNIVGTRLVGWSASGDISKAFLGYDAKGKPAKGNPRDKKNVPARVSRLNYYLHRQIILKLIGTTITN